jgi:sterol desaturase/sphingolipid hydroxylase (fatty acid hydroxylase superfamily)
MIADADPRAPQQARADTQRESPPLFENKGLDRLTRVHPSVPVLLFGPLILACFALDYRDLGPYSGVLWPLAGYFFWTLLEYWAHRSVFHLEPKHALGARFHFVIHGVHHDHPNDPKRLVLPPALSIPLAAAFFVLFVSVMGRPSVWGFAAGFYGGYLIYDMTHFALHHARPKSRLGRRLHELHMRHHFEDEDTGFGVSAPWWDIVFGTQPRRAKSVRA